MKVSAFLEERTQPILLGAFYGRYVFSKDGKKIYTEVSYKSSKFVPDTAKLLQSRDLLLEKLNAVCERQPFFKDCTNKESESPKIVLRFILENDLNLSQNSFYNKLYVKLMSEDFIYDEGLTESKKQFIRGFAESRGSIDTNRPLLALDYFYNSVNEVKRARVLYDYLNVPFSVLNFNSRELQSEYIAGKKRNTQLRFNLFWYLSNIGLLNDYKAEIVRKVYTDKNVKYLRTENGVHYFSCPEITPNRKDTFDFRLRYYYNNVFGKELSAFEIGELRKELKFDGEPRDFKRNFGLIEMIRLYAPDECAACGTTKTYTHKNTGRQYFEHHHVISLGKNYELDDENNIVKLCPTCHRTVKKGSAPENEQKEVIAKILKNRANVYAFASQIFDTDDFDGITDKIWRALK